MRLSTLEHVCRGALVWLLALAHAALWAEVMLQGGGGFRLAVAAAQCGLIAWLSIVGPGKWIVRLPLALAGLAALYVAARHAPADLLAPILAAEAVVVGLGLVILRLAGYRCVRESAGADLGPGGQYSVRSLLALTSLAAVSVFVAQAIRGQVATLAAVPPALALGATAAVLSAISLLAVWAALTPRVDWLRLALVVALAPICGAAAAYACGRDADIGQFAAVAAVQAALMCGTLLIVRLCGYQLVRRRAAVGCIARRGKSRRSISRLTKHIAGDFA